MTMVRLLILLFVALAAAACTPPAPPPAPPAAPGPPPIKGRLGGLPGANIAVNEPLHIRYPGDALFAEGAVLPLPGGTAVLDPLAGVLIDYPDTRWRAVVRARTGISEEYDRALAEQRADLLRRYFENRGIFAGRLEFTIETGEGAPLELILQPEDEAQPGAAPR